MLFPYTYVPHQMEKMQEFIDFIFHEVWCKAPGNGEFRFELFNAQPELKELVEKFHFDDTKGGDFFNSHVERIYQLFSGLSQGQVSQLKAWYSGNNDVEKVCRKDTNVTLVRYVEINADYPELSKQLANFFKGLYSPSLLSLAALKEKIGNIEDHYRAFVDVNREGKCPFCGLTDLFGPYQNKREAYDHYLPKSLYPFNSINFKNLVPACYKCNSSYKSSKDPFHPVKDPVGDSQRRKVFYPYTESLYHIELSVSLKHADIKKMRPEDIELQFGPETCQEEINTWRDVYGIDDRYRDKLLAENDGKYWLTQVLDEWREDGRAPSDYLKTLSRHTNQKPFAESNFLKKPFLEACQAAGILD